MARLLTADEKELIELMFKDNMSIEKIAKDLGRSPQTIYNHLDRVGLYSIGHTKKEKNIVPQEEKESPKTVPSFDARRTSPKKTESKLVDRMYNIKRGDIYYIFKEGITDGSVMNSGRPAIVVSNNKNNMFSSVVEIVYLTTQPKTDMPTHVEICSTGTKSTAICEQVCSISRERIANPCGVCTDAEMKMIDAALAASLGLNFNKEPVEVSPKPSVAEEEISTDYQEVVFERDTYKRLYEELLDKLVRR